MKAIRFHEHGGVENLKFEEIDSPPSHAGTVLVRIKASALNRLDLWVREGMPGVKIPLPHISGCDISGIIEALGDGVSHQKVGDEIVVSPGLSCGHCEKCLSGKDNLCRSYQIMGEHVDGGYAEFVSIPQQNILPKPQNLSFSEAASFPLVFLTAWHMLVTQGGIKPGDWVLIHAAGSGVGSAAIQIARLFNAQIITTASTSEKLAKGEALGAHHLINYKKENFAKRVKEITGKRGVDIVFEHTGEKTFEGSYLSLCKGGKLVTCGATSGHEAKIDLRYIFYKQLKILGSTMGSKGELFSLLKHFEKGQLKPVIDCEFPLKEAAKAQTYLEDQHPFGKVVLNCA